MYVVKPQSGLTAQLKELRDHLKLDMPTLIAQRRKWDTPCLLEDDDEVEMVILAEYAERLALADKQSAETFKNQGKYEQFQQEFNRQIKNLIKKGFLQLTGMDEPKFISIFEPLREQLKKLSAQEFKEGHIPFIIVPGRKLLSLNKIILCERNIASSISWEIKRVVILVFCQIFQQADLHSF